MKITPILLSITLAFKTINSKAIDNNYYSITNQINDTKVDKSYEIVKRDNFSYKFHCSEEKKVCDGIISDINYACNIISNTFEIYKPISFEVFVDDLSKYGINNANALAMDINFVPLRTSNGKSIPPYIFPQALVKQIKINKQPKYKENDFTMIIDNCDSFPENKNNELRSIIIHELLHGLGFVTGPSVIKLTDNKEEIGNNIKSPYLKARNCNNYNKYFIESIIYNLESI